jgi:hypothetical protein
MSAWPLAGMRAVYRARRQSGRLGSGQQHGLLHPLAALQALPEQPLELQPTLLPQPDDVQAEAPQVE